MVRHSRRRPMRVALSVALGSMTVAAAAESSPDRGLVPIFSIAKSENRNEVQYVLQVDDRCAPVAATPVSAYWRMLEKGPTQTAPLLNRELRAYGLAGQTVVASGADAGEVRAVLRAVPSRPLQIKTWRGSDGVCHSLTTVSIAGAPAHLFNVYVHVRWDGADYVLLQGWSLDGSHVARERLNL
jgi:hypothetical protein